MKVIAVVLIVMVLVNFFFMIIGKISLTWFWVILALFFVVVKLLFGKK